MERLIILTAWIWLLQSCSISGDGLPDIDPDSCPDQIPIVMVHGYLASGDTYSKQFQRFMANGVCREKLFAFDWNSLGTQNNTSRLNTFINTILEETGAPHVYLAGHSAGGGLGYDLLRFSAPAQKVARYVHLASSPAVALPGPYRDIPTLNIYSDADPISSGGDIPGAVNVNLADKDHYQVATSLETFIEMYRFFFDEDPAVTDLHDPSDTRVIRGRALSFGENLPAPNARIEIYELDPATGFRISTAPQFSFRPGAQGFWGPVAIKSGTYYEFLIYDDIPGNRPVHYYREPFLYDDPLVYLRTYPPPLSLGSIFLSGIPRSEEMSSVTFFGASQACVHGRDILRVNGNILSTPELTDAEQSIIAMFLYDGGDGMSSYESDPAFEAFPFLSGVDAYFSTAGEQTIEMEFNTRRIRMRNWPSLSGGVSVAVFN
jgi:pimeloyl-ACP methyl ester carboxylesterase